MSDILPAQSKRLVGYFASWAIYAQNYHITDIPAGQLTHVIYAFANVTADGDCVSVSSDDDAENFPQLLQLKQQYPNLQILISVGGASHSTHFAAVSAHAARRSHFAQSCVQFMKQNGFDGIDIDWEYPKREDRKHFTALLKKLRRQLDAQGSADKRHYLLTIAGPARPSHFANIELSLIHPLLDWINLTSYNFHTASSRVTNFNAPLFSPSDSPTAEHDRDLNVDAAVKGYLAADVPADKIVLGVRFIATGWKGVGPANNGLYQSNTGPAKGTWDSPNALTGNFGYEDIENNYLATYTRDWHSEAQVPWLYNATTGIMISYEDTQSLTLKAEYALFKKVGGVMIWELSADDSQHGLLNAIAAGLGEVTAGDTYTVSGTVTSSDGAGVGGLQVQLVDNMVDHNVFLGETTTDGFGHYSITVVISAASLQVRRKLQPDFQVRVFVGETLLTASQIVQGTANTLTIDVVLPAPSSTRLSSLNLNQPVLATLADATADPVSKLAFSTSLNAALKSQLASASTNAGYANLASLIQAIPYVDIVADKDLSLQDFVGKEVTLPTDPTQRAAAEAAIAKLSTTTRISNLLNLDAPINANPILTSTVNMAGMAILLKTSSALASNTQLIDDFNSKYAAFKGSIASLWNTLSQSDEFKSVVPELQLTLQLGTLTLANPPLVAALRAQFPQMTSPRALTSLSVTDWQQLITTHNIAVPASIAGATSEEKISNYASSIVGTLKAAFPGAYFAQGLQEATKSSNNAIDSVVVTFLNNSSDFDVLSSNLTNYITQHGDAAFRGIDATQQKAVTARLATWQRVGKVTSDFASANILVGAGFSSAYNIASTPRASFLQTVSKSLGTTVSAEDVYSKARHIAAQSMSLHANLRQALTGNFPRAIGPVGSNLGQLLRQQFQGSGGQGSGGQGSGGQGSGGLADWQTLFGSTSSCACEDCRSVYSAAAYFVGLMQFLKTPGKNSSGKTAYDALIARRPDLPYIKLNCVNTDTELPYVDLVNEILEGFVAINSGKLNQTVAHNTSNDATADELSVNPEYTKADAYNIYLNAVVYPQTLPFDRWLTTARTYLNFLGSSLYEIKSSCQTGANSADSTKGNPSGIALACEYLGISQEECIILTGKDFSGVSQPSSPPPLYEYYGYVTQTGGTFNPSLLPAGTTWEQDLCGMGDTVPGVPNFLQRTAITYDDLVALLKTRALNPNLTIVLNAAAGAPCDLTQTTIVDLPQPPQALQDTPTLSLMHRFIRLWKKLGCAISDLDKTMTSLGATDIDQHLIVSVAAIQQLQTALNLPLLQVLSFWSDLDTDGRDSLYLTLFQNKAVLNPPDPAFQLNYTALLTTPPTLQFPSPLFPNLIYGVPPGYLLLTTGMSSSEFDQLAQLSSDPIFLAKIITLYNSTAPFEVALAPLPVAQLQPALYSGGQVTYIGAMPDDYRANLNFSSDPTYQTAIDAVYDMRTLGGVSVANSSQPWISNHLPAILAALGISAQDLALIRTYKNLADPDPANPSVSLTLANLSSLCGYAFLAQGLGLSVSDLLSVIALIGVDPLQLKSPTQTLAFVQQVEAIQASPFSIAQLNYLYRHVFDPNAGIAPLPANVNLLLTTLQSGLAGVAHDNAIVPDPKGVLLTKNLAILLGTSLATAEIGLITGTAVWSAPLGPLPGIPPLPSFVTYDAVTQTLSIQGAMTNQQLTTLLGLSTNTDYQAAVNGLYAASQAGGSETYSQPLVPLPGINFPSLSSGTIAYDAAAQQLRFTGMMTSVELSTLLALSTDPSYQGAVTNLHQQPIDFINANFQSFLAPNNPLTNVTLAEAANHLIENPNNLSSAQKIAWVTQLLMPYLQQTLSKSLITQTLCDNLGFDPRLGGLLLNTILKSQVSPSTASAMADFLALVGDGLTGAYYANGNLSGSPVLSRVDAAIDFDWGFGFPDPSISAHPFSVRWTGWLMPQYSETYTFYVEAANVMSLQVGGQSVIPKQPNVTSGSIPLTAGQLYQIELDYYDNATGPVVRLSWQSPSTTKAVIPQSQLFSGAVIQSLTPIINSYILLYKVNLLASTFSLTYDDVAYFFQHGLDFKGVDPIDPSNPAKFVPFDPNYFAQPAIVLPAFVAYNVSTQTLSMSAPAAMTAAEEAQLLALSSDPSYQTAVSALYASSQTGVYIQPLAALPINYSPATFNQWQRLNAVVGLRSGLPGGDAGLLNVFAIAAGGTGSTSLTPTDPLTAAIVQATGWNATDLVFLAGTSGFGLTYADFTNEAGTKGIGLVQLQVCARLLSRLGVSAEQLFSWSAFGPDTSNSQLIDAEQPIAADIQNTVKAKYSDATWVTVGKPLNNSIRQASTDALIAYILAGAAGSLPIAQNWNMVAPNDGGPITTADQLYEFFLIDVEMSTCMLTSRIVQANAAIQLFVQRCLLNLESSVPPSAIDTTFWEWMQNFRVWQANVEVFYHPENWMVPTLRDDMTPFFKDLENTLLQNPINSDTVTQAYLDYLTALDEVARLDIRGTYWQLSYGGPALDGTADASYDVLHVFGRTQTQPHKYYYRRLLNCSWYGTQAGLANWTPWEEVGANIQADHLVPVVWDGRLYLFWPSFAQSAETSNQDPIPIPSPGDKTYPPSSPVMDLSITLNWSEYKQSAWTPKRSSDPLVFPGFRDRYGSITNLGGSTIDVSQFSFNSWIRGDGSLWINVYGWVWPGLGPVVTGQIGQFLFSECGGNPSPLPFSFGYGPISPINPLLPYGSVDPSPPTANLWNSVCGFAPATPGGSSSLTLSAMGLELPIGIAPPWGSYTTSPAKALGNSPGGIWTLMFPQQFYDSFGLILPTPAIPVADGQNIIEPGQPFFYQDNLENYFVTEKFNDGSIAVNDVNSESPFYSRSGLVAGPQIGNVSVIFPTKALARAGGPAPAPGRNLAGGIVAPTSVSSPAIPMDVPANNQGSLSQIQFSMFSHPHVCAFIETINRYGLSNFLSIATQARTNDNGVIAGFVLSDGVPSLNLSTALTPGLSPGILVAQGQLYEATKPPDPGPMISTPTAPLQQYLYYTIAPTDGSTPPRSFYYSDTQTPRSPGDAFIGSVLFDFFFAVPFSGSTIFEAQYQPNKHYISPYTFPLENVDFTPTGAYSIYNWELFFHIPLLIATQLSANQQFEDAQKWFHYIFNPISSSNDSGPQRYWKFLPFYECAPADNVLGQLLLLLGLGPSLCGQGVGEQVYTWKNDPFNPFAIARLRTIAFRMKVVMAYLDNLIAWGDNLFAQNTRESINEATQIYVLANEILGPRPIQIPQQGTTQDYSYNDLVTLFGIDALGNAIVLIENDLPYAAGYGGSASSGLGVAISMASVIPYFCLPANDTLNGYWDTVDDRLYKIRHCMNIQGEVEQLPLFAPRISPALLVAAQAEGVDLSSVLSNINAATPFYRFSIMVQKALELCAEVRSLGAALLSALEKQDAEALSLLRATQETQLLQAMQQMKELAVQEAQATVAGLEASQKTATDRQTYYSGLLSKGEIDQENQQASALNQAANQHSLADIFFSDAENDALYPEASIGISGFGGTPSIGVSMGGPTLVSQDNAFAGQAQNAAASFSNAASQSGLQVQWYRRNQEWGFQAAQAADEIAQIAAQISAATFRVQIAQQDQANLNLQIQNAQKVQDFLAGKYTNQQLYSWMVDQISTVFFQCYQMAYNLATQAEAAFRFQRGLATSSYIQFGYWDSLKKGLMSGERLYADLKRMEIAYLESDVREYEISKSISLVLFDPWALIALKETGRCAINLPEPYFDTDYPGLYFRRLKTVSLLIPCVTGPYTSVNCILTLLNSKVRVDNKANSLADYASDAHFITNYAATQSIATSTAQNDSGLFELNFQDPRYLPFEGAGAISTWQIELPPDCNAFDFETISDVVLNIKYTARDGGDILRQNARLAATLPTPPAQGANATNLPPFPRQTDLRRLFSLKHEFSSEWYKFLNPSDTADFQSMQIALSIERFPYQYRGKKITISSVDLFLKFKDLHDPKTFTHDGTPLGDYAGGTALTVSLQPPTGSAADAKLASASTLLNGLPFAAIPFTTGTPPGLGSWTLMADNGHIASIATSLQNIVTSGVTTYNHLNAAVIDDIVMVCHYSAK
jgi:GH18 family chitinase